MCACSPCAAVHVAVVISVLAAAKEMLSFGLRYLSPWQS
jgi:hypothetical protein